MKLISHYQLLPGCCICLTQQDGKKAQHKKMEQVAFATGPLQTNILYVTNKGALQWHTQISTHYGFVKPVFLITRSQA